MENTLYNKIVNEIELTADERLSLYELVSSGCHKKNKERLYHRLCEYTFPILGKAWGIYQRVYFEDGNCRYYAGQHYPSEIRLVRKLLLEA